MTPGPRPRRVDPAGVTVAVALAVLAAILFWDAARLPPARGYSGIGPADTPRLVGGALALLALWALLDAVRKPAEAPPAQDLPPVLWIVGGLGLQLLLFKTAGFSVAAAALFACVAAAFGRRRLWVTLPVGVVFGLAIFAVFGLGLDLSLPAGPPERLLFGL